MVTSALPLTDEHCHYRYHEVLDVYEANMDEDDYVQEEDPVADEEAYQLTESMDRIVKAKETKEPGKKRTKKTKAAVPHPSEVASGDVQRQLDGLGVGIKDGDPSIYSPLMMPKDILSPPKSAIPVRKGFRSRVFVRTMGQRSSRGAEK